MDEVFSLIFQGIVGAVDGLKALTFTAYGYTISLYDWYLALFVLSALFPIVFVGSRFWAQNEAKAASERARDDSSINSKGWTQKNTDTYNAYLERMLGK